MLSHELAGLRMGGWGHRLCSFLEIRGQLPGPRPAGAFVLACAPSGGQTLQAGSGLGDSIASNQSMPASMLQAAALRPALSWELCGSLC